MVKAFKRINPNTVERTEHGRMGGSGKFMVRWLWWWRNEAIRPMDSYDLGLPH